MKNKIHDIFFDCFCIAIIVLIFNMCCHACDRYLEKEVGRYYFELETLDDDGNYVIYNRTVSSVPAYNYENITVSYNGELHRLSGNVEIVFCEYKKDIEIVDVTGIYQDRLYLSVPKRTVVYEKDIAVE